MVVEEKHMNQSVLTLLNQMLKVVSGMKQDAEANNELSQLERQKLTELSEVIHQNILNLSQNTETNLNQLQMSLMNELNNVNSNDALDEVIAKTAVLNDNMDALIKIARGEADVAELVEARQTLGQMLDVIEGLPRRLKGLVDEDLQKRKVNVKVDNRIVEETVKREVDKQFSAIRDEILNKYGSLDDEMISRAFKEHNDRFATAIKSYESRIDKLVGLKAKTKSWFTGILSSLLVIALVTGASIGFFAPLVNGFFTGSGITDLLVQGRDNVFAPSDEISWGLRTFSGIGTFIFALIYYGLPFVCMFGLLKFLRRQDWF